MKEEVGEVVEKMEKEALQRRMEVGEKVKVVGQKGSVGV